MSLKVSIVTPSYNQGEFIKETIDSVLSQDVTLLEYVVIDGGSDDQTKEILVSYGDKIVWESKPDKGQADAVNKGIRMTSGDIIGWLNSDDIYYPGAIKSVVDIFEANEDIMVIYGLADHIDKNGNYLEDYYTEDWDYENLKNVCFICQPSLFFRRSLVEKCGYLNVGLNFCMDYEYWLRLGRSEKFYCLKKKIAGSRLYETNKTLGNRRRVHEEIIDMQKCVLGKASERWIYNLAHIMSDEKNLPRETPEQNYVYVKDMVGNAIRIFKKSGKSFNLCELMKILTWIFAARRDYKKNENRL